MALYLICLCAVFLYNFNLNSVTAPTAKRRLPLFRIIVNNGFESLEGMSYVAFLFLVKTLLCLALYKIVPHRVGVGNC